MIYNTVPTSGAADWILETGFPQRGVGDLDDLRLELGVGEGGRWVGFLHPGWFYSEDLEQYHFVVKGEQTLTATAGVNVVNAADSFRPGWGPVVVTGGPATSRSLYTQHHGSYYPATTLSWTVAGSGMVVANMPANAALVGVRDLTNLPLGAVSASGELITDKFYFYDRAAGKIYHRPKDTSSVKVYADVVYYEPKLKLREVVAHRADGTVQASYARIADVTVSRGPSSVTLAGLQDGRSILHGLDDVYEGDWIVLEYYVERSYVVVNESLLHLYTTPGSGEDVTIAFETSVPDVLPALSVRVPGVGGSLSTSTVWSARTYAASVASTGRAGSTDAWADVANARLEDGLYAIAAPLGVGDVTEVLSGSGFAPQAAIPGGATLQNVRMRFKAKKAVPPNVAPVGLYCDYLMFTVDGAPVGSNLADQGLDVPTSDQIWSFTSSAASLGLDAVEANEGRLGYVAGFRVDPESLEGTDPDNWQISYSYNGTYNNNLQTFAWSQTPSGTIRSVTSPIYTNAEGRIINVWTNGSITVSVTWIGTGAAPDVCPLTIYAEAGATVGGGSFAGTVNNGIGSGITYLANGIVASGHVYMALELVNGVGSITYTQSANSTCTAYGGFDVFSSASASWGVVASIGALEPVTGMVEFASMEYQYTTSVFVPTIDGAERLNFNPLFKDSYRAGYLTNTDVETPHNGLWVPESIDVGVDRTECNPAWGEPIKVTVTVFDRDGIPIPKHPLRITSDRSLASMIFLTESASSVSGTEYSAYTDNRGEFHCLVTPPSGVASMAINAIAGTVSGSQTVSLLTTTQCIDSTRYLDGQMALVVTDENTSRLFKLAYVSRYYLDGIPRDATTGVTLRTERASTLEYRSALDGLFGPFDTVAVREATVPTLQRSLNPGGVAAFGYLPQPKDKIIALYSGGQSRVREEEF